MTARTLYDKIWDDHVVHQAEDGTCLLYIDRHLVHEVTSPQAFEGLRMTGRKVRAPEKTIAVPDHNVPTTLDRANAATMTEESRVQVAALDKNAKDFGINYYPVSDVRQGIVHIVGPEQGWTLPGMTVVCGDSHTATHGAFGSLAHGIGTSEVEHVLATQTIRQRKSRNMRIVVEGQLAPYVHAKDLALHLLGMAGVDGATGHVIEYAGEAIRALSMEARMTLCNLSIEMGARGGLVAPDATTFAYLAGRPAAPAGAAWDAALACWYALASDDGAAFDRELSAHADDVRPMVSWGTNPSQVVAIDGCVPDPATLENSEKRDAAARALAYMDLSPGMPLAGQRLDRVFIGSCTNSRIEDLRVVAGVVRGRRVASHVRAMVVPGSGLVKRQAEEEGIDRVLRDAGFDWREPGCSMCVGMNADRLQPGERCAATSNRNFENRQGRGGRTHLMSPALAAASAIAGCIAAPEMPG